MSLRTSTLLLLIAGVSTEAAAAEVFVHTASKKGASTPLSQTAADARVFVTPTQALAAPVGVAYDKGRWSIAATNGAQIAKGSKFNVLVLPPDAAGAFVHVATKTNVRGHETALEHPAIAKNPRVMPIVTPRVTSRARPTSAVGVRWTGDTWTIFRQDGKPMRPGATFHVLVAGRGGAPVAWDVRVHRVAKATKRDALAKKDEDAKLFVTPTLGPDTPRHARALGVRFDRGAWHVVSRAPLPAGLLINVLAVDPARPTAPEAESGRPPGPTAGLRLPELPSKVRPVDQRRRAAPDVFGPIVLASGVKPGVCLDVSGYGSKHPLTFDRCRDAPSQTFVYHRDRRELRVSKDPTKCLWASAEAAFVEDCTNAVDGDRGFRFVPKDGTIRTARDPTLCLRAADDGLRPGTRVVLGACDKAPAGTSSWGCRRASGFASKSAPAAVDTFCAR